MELEKLGALVDDASVLQRLLDVKSSRKTELKDYLAKTQGIVLMTIPFTISDQASCTSTRDSR